jgi:cytidylate kinase
MKIQKPRPLQHIVEEQINRWKSSVQGKEEKKITVVTVSRQPGSGGHYLAEQLAGELGFDFFGKKITQEIAESTHMRAQWVQSLEDKGVSAIEDMLAAVIEKHHLWNYEYIQNLAKVIGTIGKHGNAVILGRGANFILPREENLRVRVIAPLEIRVKNLAEWLKIPSEQAKEYVQKTELERNDFIRKYFKANINDPENFDLVLNMEKFNIKDAIELIKIALKSKYYRGEVKFY